MRNLKTADLFTMSRIVKRMNIKKEIEGLAKDVTGLSEAEKTKAEHQLGIDLTMIFVENIGNAEKECYKFLADLSGETPQEIEDQPINKTLDMIGELTKQAGFGSFLSTALKATK